MTGSATIQSKGNKESYCLARKILKRGVFSISVTSQHSWAALSLLPAAMSFFWPLSEKALFCCWQR